MFRKPFKVKSNNAIRGSERRKLRDHVNKSFPQLLADDLSLLVPNKETMSVMNISTHSEKNVTCYCLQKNPILFDVDGTLLPTVYTLWKYPHMILSFQTNHNVFPILAGGADLMFPGVISPLTSFPEFAANTPSYVTLVGSGAAVAVGITSCSKQSILQDGCVGKRVSIFHCFKDHLWALGEKIGPPMLPEITYDNPVEDNIFDDSDLKNGEVDGNLEDDDKLSTNVREMELSCNNGHHENTNGCPPDVELKETNGSCDNDFDADILNDSPILSPQEQMDSLLQNCFYQALIDAKNVELPMLVSKFSSQYLHAACPEGERIDVKKSTYKKMSRFLNEMQGRGVVVVKELSKGVESIIAINVINDEIMKYRSTTFAQDRKKVKSKKLEEEKQLKKQLNQTIEIKELFAVSAKVVPFFQVYKISKGSPLSSTEVRQYVTQYVRDHELINGENKRQINLDPLLTDILFTKGSHEDTLTWDGIMTRLLNNMNPCHEVKCPGEKPVVRKGKMVLIDVSIEQRMGNKKVTVVKNLEAFGIDVKVFAQALQQAAASSTAVNPVPGKNSGGNLVIVQGIQMKHIKTLLESYKVPLKYVTGLQAKKK